MMIQAMKQVVTFLLRLPPELHEELRQWAEQEGRSLHNLVLWVLRRALREWRGP